MWGLKNFTSFSPVWPEQPFELVQSPLLCFSFLSRRCLVQNLYSCGGFTNPKPSFVLICQLLYFVFNTIQCGDCHRVVKAKHRVSFLRQHFLVHRPGKLSPSFLSSSFIIVGAFGNFSCLIQCLLPCSFAVRQRSTQGRRVEQGWVKRWLGS